MFEFLEELSSSITDLANKELTILTDLKVSVLLLFLYMPCLFHLFNVLGVMEHQKKEEQELPFGVEDLLYYIKRVEEQEFHLDFGVLKQYFPVNLVLSGIIKISQDLFGNIY